MAYFGLKKWQLLEFWNIIILKLGLYLHFRFLKIYTPFGMYVTMTSSQMYNFVIVYTFEMIFCLEKNFLGS